MHLAWLFLLSFTLASGYAPANAACPSNSTLIREGDSVSEKEAEWIDSRHQKTTAALKEYLSNVGLLADAKFLSNASDHVNVALAFSGGGLRALLSGAGQYAALDNRTSTDDLSLAGVLQSSTYISGLSGGAWLLSSFIYQNWPTVDEMVFEDPYNVWNYTSIGLFLNTSDPLSLVYGLVANNYNDTITNAAYYNLPVGEGIKNDLQLKLNAGFRTSITDLWGRILAHLLFPQGKDNWFDSATWSEIRNLRTFANHDMPFPVVTALARRPGSLVYDLNSPIIEFNPFEMGSFDTSINTFHDVKYLGTPVKNGVPSGNCVSGFDNAAFVLGTSSSLFNQYLNTLVCPTCNSLNFIVKFFLRRFLLSMSKNKQDIAWYDPNPFYKSQYAKSDNISSSDALYLMDGGLAGEIVPLSTISVKERKLDLVFAFDNNGPDWPDGTSVINTYQRQFTYEGASTVFPYVPGQSTFEYYNLTAKPTFFGCDAKNLTDLVKDGVVPPVVIYTPNRPYEFYSNFSSLKLTYSDNEKKGMVANGFDVATHGNNTEYPTCVGCAMIRRSQERQGIEQSEECKKCFEDYCWDGSVYEDSSYVAPAYFTEDGRTSEPQSLDTYNAYIQKTSSLTSIVSELLKNIVPSIFRKFLSLF